MKVGDLVKRCDSFKEWMKYNSWMTLEEEQEIEHQTWISEIVLSDRRDTCFTGWPRCAFQNHGAKCPGLRPLLTLLVHSIRAWGWHHRCTTSCMAAKISIKGPLPARKDLNFS